MKNTKENSLQVQDKQKNKIIIIAIKVIMLLILLAPYYPIFKNKYIIDVRIIVYVEILFIILTILINYLQNLNNIKVHKSGFIRATILSFFVYITRSFYLLYILTYCAGNLSRFLETIITFAIFMYVSYINHFISKLFKIKTNDNNRLNYYLTLTVFLMLGEFVEGIPNISNFIYLLFTLDIIVELMKEKIKN